MASRNLSRLGLQHLQAFREQDLRRTVARKYGFSGGLVPGVDVLAYMLHMPVANGAAISSNAG